MNNVGGKNHTMEYGRVKSSTYDKRYLWITIAGLLLFGLAALLTETVGARVPERYFLPLHLSLEFSSIVVSFAVFVTGWYGYKRTNDLRDLIIGVTFLTTGVFDFIHTFSYQGMPDFIGANHPGKAIGYWLSARLIVGIGLLAAILTPKGKPGSKTAQKSLLLAAVAVVALVVTVMTLGFPETSEIFYQDGLTPLKIGLEYGTVFIYLLAFLLLSDKRGWDQNTVFLLRSSLLVLVFAELAFTLYVDPYGMLNALGHVFKTAAYYLILSALVGSAIQRPYDELSEAKEELQDLYRDAQAHRREIEESFSRIGNALSSSLNTDEALDQISQLAVDMLHADCSIVASMNKISGEVQIAAQKGGCHDAYRPTELTLKIGADAIREQKSIVLEDLELTGLIKCEFSHDSCLRSMVCAPMIYEGQALGVITIYSHAKNAFEKGDVSLLEAFASHAAVAIHNAMSYERESKIANILQQSFLSSPSIETEKFDIAQVYKPASNEALVGGDFYDLIDLDNNKIGLVIGDVSGKGLAAAVHTAMVKYALRAYLYEGHAPAKAMELLNVTVSESVGLDQFITLFLGVLDTETGELVYSNAGHEPPVYACSGSYTALESTGPALGFGAKLGYEQKSVTLEKGCVLFLYTDGISEARRGGQFLGTEGIGEELLVCDSLGSEDVAKCVHTRAIEFAGGELKDDAAILAVRAKA